MTKRVIDHYMNMRHYDDHDLHRDLWSKISACSKQFCQVTLIGFYYNYKIYVQCSDMQYLISNIQYLLKCERYNGHDIFIFFNLHDMHCNNYL